jgi:NTP-dependent ternary system trypsin peptidase co-occuring protein
MSYLIDVPVDGGGRLLVEASATQLPDELDLASARPGQVIARAGSSLEDALDGIKPAIRAVLQAMRAAGPDEVCVDFGLTLGAETGVVVAKGTSEVHFNVTVSWKRAPAGGDDRTS